MTPVHSPPSSGRPGARKPSAWRDARALLWSHRYRLLLGLVLILLGLVLILLGRGAGFVLPASSKILIDEVIGKGRGDLLVPLAAAVVAASLVQAASAFAIARVLGLAAQRSIMALRRSIQRRVTRLPIRYFDAQKTGVLVSRIMSDAEGVRNLLGTGLVSS